MIFILFTRHLIYIIIDMSLAELAKRHREKGGNRDSGSRLTLGDKSKKKESKGSGALSLSDLLNKKKTTDQPKKPLNLKNLVGAKPVQTETAKDQPQSDQVRSILKIEKKVEKLSLQDKTTSR